MAQRPWSHWLHYRLAWAYNRLELPDSALAPARAAWEMSPQNQWYMGEYLRSLYHLQRYREMLGLADVVRGGGVCRYYLARAEEALDTLESSRQWLRRALNAPGDSVAADAASWLSVLSRERLGPDSVLALVRMAAELRPNDRFYRARLVEELARAGLLQEAWDNLRSLRLLQEPSQSYWSAWASYAEAEGDRRRRIWALRRAYSSRRCPSNARDLGWALYLAGRDTLRAGHAAPAAALLRQASAMGCSTEIFAVKADSLLGLMREIGGL